MRFVPFRIDDEVIRSINFEDLEFLKEEDLVVEPVRYSENKNGFERVNESAVKITHKPTGLFYIGYTQRAQAHNRNKALLELNKIVGDNVKNIHE